MAQVKLTRVPVDVDADRLTRKVRHVRDKWMQSQGKATPAVALHPHMLGLMQVIRSFPRQLDPVSVKYEQVVGHGWHTCSAT